MKTLVLKRKGIYQQIRYDLTEIASIDFEPVRFDRQSKEQAIIITFISGKTSTLKAAEWYISFE